MVAESKVHFHVLVGLSGGYMPDANDGYRDRADAMEGAAEAFRQWSDQAFDFNHPAVPDAETVSAWDATEAALRAGKIDYAILPDGRSAQDRKLSLPWYVQVTDCDEGACLDEIDE